MWSKSRRRTLSDISVALVLTGAVHVGLFLLFDSEIRVRKRIVAPIAHGELVLIFDARQVDQARAVPTQPRRKPVPSEGPGQTERRASPASLAQATSDWEATAILAVQGEVERVSQGFRSLDSKPKNPIFELEKHVPGMFDRGPAHKVGLVEYAGDGVFRTWITPYCYMLSGMTSLGRKEVKRCQSSGSKYGPDNVFGEFRPKYLEKPPASVRSE